MLMTEEALIAFYDHGELGSKRSYDYGELLHRGSAAQYLDAHC